MRYGEEMIANSKLEAVPNPNPERDYIIDMTCPEFTCLCPRSGFPDFATMHIRFIPDLLIIELKSLKLYINQYRNEYAFHEGVTNKILNDLVALIQPRWMRIDGNFTVRGNIKTIITVKHIKEGFDPRSSILGPEITSLE